MTRTPLPLHRRFLPHTHGLEDVAILTDHDLQRMYELAYGVHPPLSAVVLTRRTVAQLSPPRPRYPPGMAHSAVTGTGKWLILIWKNFRHGAAARKVHGYLRRVGKEKMVMTVEGTQLYKAHTICSLELTPIGLSDY
jgi:hypothetical protein